MNLKHITIGKHTLETLTNGMYTDHFTIFREYVQNSADSIDNAVKSGILEAGAGIINVTVNKEKSLVTVHDNGTGICSELTVKFLCDIGNSSKDYKENRGFRGIGRLGGLAYAQSIKFVTTAKGEDKKTIITWDCAKLLELLQPGKFQEYDLIKVIKEVTKVDFETEEVLSHYFEVSLLDIDEKFEDLLNVEKVKNYLSTVAPVPFNHQIFFRSAHKIKEWFSKKGIPIEEYKIYLNDSEQILKLYKETFNTGHQDRTKKKDRIADIQFFEFKDEDKLLYCGWHAVTAFYGSVDDEFMKGIRVRKGNILIGDKNTFSQFFPSEKDVANSWFIGEVYMYDNELIPNGRRDDFEKNTKFQIISSSLSEKANELNKRYRREMSIYNSSIKKIEISKKELECINAEIDSGGITSDVRRDQLIKQKEVIEQKIENGLKDIKKLAEKFDNLDEKKTVLDKYIKEADVLKKKIVIVETKITNADYVTKNDLPTSFSKEERKIYQEVIAVIDENVDNDIAVMLRRKILERLTASKKRK